MTDRLYLADSHLSSCTATVTACHGTADGYDLELDRSVFFPNAGGQPSDTGTFTLPDGGTVAITGADELDDGTLFHHATAPVAPGTAVTAAIDWDRRFDLMQQHTGEHMLSWAASVLYGATNVGFHLTTGYGTIDLDIPLTAEQVRAIEAHANACCEKNLAVTARLYESEEAIRDIPLRKHAEGLTAPIRIVFIEGADTCTCCAPHCYTTGEVGPLFFTEAVSYKGGTRLTFLCGQRALRYLRETHDSLDAIARHFSTARTGAVEAGLREGEELAACRRHEKELAAKCRSHLAEELKAGAETIGKWKLIAGPATGMEPGDLRPLAQQALTEDACILLFAGSGERVSYLLMTGKRVSLDTAELAAAVNAATGGKGGGRNGSAQGSAPAEAVRDGGMDAAIGYLRARLKALK